MLIARIALALASASLLAAPAAAQFADVALAQSTFAAGTEGWLSVTLPFPSAVPPTILGSFTPTWVASLGGYIRLEDPDGSQPTGMTQYWKAPAAFLGAKSAAYGGSLQFDLANSGGTGLFTQEDLILQGAGLTLVHALGGTPVPAFTHFSIPMSETGWKVGGLAGPAATAAQMQSVLAGLDVLFLRGEYRNAVDTQFLDNVTLAAGPAAGGPWTTLGFGLAGISGIPSLIGTGTLVAGSPGSLALGNARAAAPAILFVSFASIPSPFKGGTLATVPVALAVTLMTNGAGALTLPWIWPAGIPPATSLYFQYAIQDAAGPKGASLSHALKGLTP
ncbi:MAG TPA: laminin B domain-containing protein [Planctomycetota bacterium]|nr:laminin B domain-containing protein [Planctomycetota bacterium]